MSIDERFKSGIIAWLCKNGFANIEVDFEYDFGYAVDDYKGIHCLNIGVEANDNAGNYFEQFLYEYGCEYVGIPYPILALIHELGHVTTISNFSPTEMNLFYLAKQFDHGESEHDWYFRYWEMPDEFAATMWAVDFINNHIDAVEELCNFFIPTWIEMCETIDVFSLVKEAA